MSEHRCRECSAAVLAIDVTIDPRRIAMKWVAPCGHDQSAETVREMWRDGFRWTIPVLDGASLGAAERYRQVHSEGYTPAADDALNPDDLTWAAWCLLDAAASGGANLTRPKMWPNGVGEWKPEHSPLRRLVIAQAMIAAEIDRRLRLERREGSS